MHVTPSTLAELAPPTSSKFRLSFKDHRFKVVVMSEAEHAAVEPKVVREALPGQKRFGNTCSVRLTAGCGETGLHCWVDGLDRYLGRLIGR